LCGTNGLQLWGLYVVEIIGEQNNVRSDLQWEDNSRQHQGILNNIQIPTGLQAKRKL